MLQTFHEDPKDSYQLVENGPLMPPLKTTDMQSLLKNIHEALVVSTDAE